MRVRFSLRGLFALLLLGLAPVLALAPARADLSPGDWTDATKRLDTDLKKLSLAVDTYRRALPTDLTIIRNELWYARRDALETLPSSLAAVARDDSERAVLLVVAALPRLCEVDVYDAAVAALASMKSEKATAALRKAIAQEKSPVARFVLAGVAARREDLRALFAPFLADKDDALAQHAVELARAPDREWALEPLVARLEALEKEKTDRPRLHRALSDALAARLGEWHEHAADYRALLGKGAKPADSHPHTVVREADRSLVEKVAAQDLYLAEDPETGRMGEFLDQERIPYTRISEVPDKLDPNAVVALNWYVAHPKNPDPALHAFVEQGGYLVTTMVESTLVAGFVGCPPAADYRPETDLPLRIAPGAEKLTPALVEDVLPLNPFKNRWVVWDHPLTNHYRSPWAGGVPLVEFDQHGTLHPAATYIRWKKGAILDLEVPISKQRDPSAKEREASDAIAEHAQRQLLMNYIVEKLRYRATGKR